jgi:hypothetical protein
MLRRPLFIRCVLSVHVRGLAGAGSLAPWRSASDACDANRDPADCPTASGTIETLQF